MHKEKAAAYEIVESKKEMKNIIVQLKLIKNASGETSCDQSLLNSHICIRNW